MRTILAVVIGMTAAWPLASPRSARGAEQTFAGKGWCDVVNCPPQHPGPCPWLKKEDTPEQAKLRKELAGMGRIVYCSNRDGNWEIYSCNPDGGDQKNLTNNGGWDFYPRWTRDGKVLFLSDRDAAIKLGTVYDQLMERQQWGVWGYFGYPAYYNKSLDREKPAMEDCGVYLMDADGSNVKLLVKNAQYANMSPDGKFLVFERRSKAITLDLATGEEFDACRRYFGGNWWPEFSPDGTRLLVSTGGDIKGKTGAHEPPPLVLMATLFDLQSDYRALNPVWNLQRGGMTACCRWRPDGNGVVIVQGSRELNLQELDLAEKPDDNGWLVGKTIGLAQPADRWMHAHPAYCPAGKYIAFSLSPIHYLVREIKGTQGVELKDMGYKPWKDGNQIAWQELCVGHAVAGQDNVYVQITEGGFANRNADWWVPPDQRVKPGKPVTATSVENTPIVKPTPAAASAAPEAGESASSPAKQAAPARALPAAGRGGARGRGRAPLPASATTRPAAGAMAPGASADE